MTAQENVHADSVSVPQGAATTSGSGASTCTHTDKTIPTRVCATLVNGAGSVMDSPTGDAHTHAHKPADTPTHTHTDTASLEVSGGVAEGEDVCTGPYATEGKMSSSSMDSEGPTDSEVQRSVSSAAGASVHTTPSLPPSSSTWHQSPPSPASRTPPPRTQSPPPSSSPSSSLHPSKASSSRAHPPLLLLLTTATCLLHAAYTLCVAHNSYDHGARYGGRAGAGHTGAPAAYTLAHWATQTFPHNRNVHITAVQALTHYAMTSHRAHECVCAQEGVGECRWDVRDAEGLVMDSMRAYPTFAPLQSAGILALHHLHTHTHTAHALEKGVVSRSDDACGDGCDGGVVDMTRADVVGTRDHARLCVGGRGCEGSRDNVTSPSDALSLIEAAMRMHPMDSVVQQRGREAVVHILA